MNYPIIKQKDLVSHKRLKTLEVYKNLENNLEGHYNSNYLKGFQSKVNG